MGREIRRVPPWWEHPKDSKGRYLPLLDVGFSEAMADWNSKKAMWQMGLSEDVIKEPSLRESYTFEEWYGDKPDPRHYRPAWTEEEATHYQVYETVTEGTPTSPVFASLDELQEWLIEQGHNEYAVSEFIKRGWAPSMVVVPGRGASPVGIDSLAWLGPAKEEGE